MKTRIAVAAALALAACASVEGTSSSGAARVASAPASGTYYRWKEKLSEQGDMLSCNWQANMNDACRMSVTSTLSRGSLSSGPSDARRCENGQWLVKATMK